MTHPLHPTVVHFPIALLFTAVFFAVLEALLKRDVYNQILTWLLGLGVLSAVAAVVTGVWEEERVEAAGVPEHAIEQHETLAFATLAVFAVLLAMQWFRGRRWMPSHPALFFIIAFAGLTLLGMTGYYGGDLVYRYGAGVEQAAPPPVTERSGE
jgi:uncharacterized membrane protein